MPDIERLFDTHGANASSGGSPYEFVANKFMHIDTEIEVEENGKKIKKRILDVDARTELNSPVAFASSETLGVYISRAFKFNKPKWVQEDQDLLDLYLARVKIAMINKDRKGRIEAKEILSAYFGGQRFNSPENLAEQVLKK